MSILLINGKPASISETKFAQFHGESIFTTFRSHKDELLLWPYHWQRLTEHAQFFGYSMPNETDVLKLIRENIKHVDHKLRVIITRTSFAITIEKYTPPPPQIYDGCSVILSSWQVHPMLARFKTGNSLPYHLAHKEALEQGAFEALLTNHEGFIVDGSRTSLLLFDGSRMIALEGGLEGSMRAHVIDTLTKKGMKCERAFLRNDDLNYGQLLLANSLIGLVPQAPIKYAEVNAIVNLFRPNHRGYGYK